MSRSEAAQEEGAGGCEDYGALRWIRKDAGEGKRSEHSGDNRDEAPSSLSTPKRLSTLVIQTVAT